MGKKGKARAAARRYEVAADEALARSRELLEVAAERCEERCAATARHVGELAARAENQVLQTSGDLARAAGQLLDAMEGDAQAVRLRRSQFDETLRAIEAGANHLETESIGRVRSLVDESEALAGQLQDASHRVTALIAHVDRDVCSTGEEARRKAAEVVAQVESDLQPARSQVAEIQGVIAEIEAASRTFDEDFSRVRESLEVRVDELVTDARRMAETEIARSISELRAIAESGNHAGASGDGASSLENRAAADADMDESRAVEAEPCPALHSIALGHDAAPTDHDDATFFASLAAELGDPADEVTGPRGTERDAAWSGAEPPSSTRETHERVDRGAVEQLPGRLLTAPRPAVEVSPIDVHVPLDLFALCAQELAVGGPDQLVRLELSCPGPQQADHGHLGLVTYDVRGWWECNGLVVSVDVEEPRSVIVDLHDLLSVLAEVAHREGARETIVTWQDNIEIDGHVLPAADPTRVPGLSRDRRRIEHVSFSDGVRSGCILETQMGRLHLSAHLGEHLYDCDVRTAELIEMSDKPFLSARSKIAADARTAPLILAPLEMLMRGAPVPAPAAAERRKRKWR